MYKLQAPSFVPGSRALPLLVESAGNQGSREGDLGPPDTGHSRWQPLWLLLKTVDSVT